MSKGGLVKSILSKFKAPWAMTGPLASPEYQTHLIYPSDYRQHAPGSQPLRAIVPAADNDKVYDIQYYTRDARRAHLLGGTLEHKYYDFSAEEGKAAMEKLEEAPTPGKRWVHKPYQPILEEENNGYTV